jgi:isocitrate dehydrogenase
MTSAHPITVAYGDGIGPEIMHATLLILKEAGAKLAIETIEVGEKQYKFGNTSGIPERAWEALRRTRVLLKAPITTPQGGGYKSLNVTMRKTLGLYANIRPCVSYHPFVATHHPKMDLVIVRENEEDLYAGIEYQQTADIVHSIKLISRSGSERIIRYAFDYALQNGRKKVTCMSKDNIMKLADGMFHRLFEQTALEYPSLETDHYIIDIGTAKIASSPQRFDVIVTENLYGDIISDVAAEVSGSVGLAGSSNIGTDFAMFEAIHGSAPDIAGQDIANPSGLLGGAVMMLIHIGQAEVAETVQNAWLATLEDGIHTADIFNAASREKVGTQGFAEAVIGHLGQKPRKLEAVSYATRKAVALPPHRLVHAINVRTLVGVDCFVRFKGDLEEGLAQKLQDTIGDLPFRLQTISSKGLKIWPDYHEGAHKTDQINCRYLKTRESIAPADAAMLMLRLCEAGIDVIKTEQLYDFDEKHGYTLGQGE